MSRLSAPIFDFGNPQSLASDDSYALNSALPALPWPCTGQLAMTGPSVRFEPGHLPVRGDLAHIKLAGRYFVPHYAAPIRYVAGASGAVLRKAGRAEGEAIMTLDAGTGFDVLDIAGGWAWGQLVCDDPDEEGFVGYVTVADLEKAQ